MFFRINSWGSLGRGSLGRDSLGRDSNSLGDNRIRGSLVGRGIII